MLRNVPAAVAAERTRNSRRLVADCVDLSMAGSLIRHLGGPVRYNFAHTLFELGSSFLAEDAMATRTPASSAARFTALTMRE